MIRMAIPIPNIHRFFMENRPFIALAGKILIALTIIACTFLFTHTIKQIKFGPGNIDVKGCAEKEIQSDFVQWSGSISTTNESLIPAYEKMEQDLEIFREYLKSAGVDINIVEFSPLTQDIIYKQTPKGITTHEIERYILCQNFNIASTNIPLITQISQNISSLIKKGVSVRSYSPMYFYLKIEELKIEMLGEAAKDAHERAEVLVSKSGSKIGKLRSARQGVFQITPAHSTSISDYGELDTSSVLKRIKAVVTMEFDID